MITTTWILIANSSEAKLYATKKLNGDWQLVNEWQHPQSREKDLDLVSDKPGRYHSRTYNRGAFEDTSDPKQVEANNFAYQLATALDAGRVNNEYQKLIVAATPHFHGLLNKHCNVHVAALISHHLEKDYTKLKMSEIKNHIEHELP